ncbi:GNAT family N-acetyltransferase [Turicibacter sanguinis]|nr:GNAT family N-acetyltransferase [Turicibacter sanguinis]MTP47972.1 GNAT family N-acetyltransferase [Turicibacter sanguinis]MTP50720.1 GNAT family N-acetyltransferase [Turicibacter sanguinis]MTQ07956.1 GNAT family N-acetyltransferase [Turicibacter sanguinis]
MLEDQVKVSYSYFKTQIDNLEYFRKLDDFNCGDQGLNDFLQGQAIFFHGEGRGLTTLIINEENNDIMGYYTIRCNALQYDTKSTEMRYVITPGEDNSTEKYINLYEVIPVVEITRFAIDDKYKRKKVGATVLSNLIIEIINNIASIIGVTAIFVLSSETAVDFYKYIGFEEFPEDIQKRIKESETSRCKGLYYTLSPLSEEDD